MANTSANKVLFISHEASRSGAPIVLLHLLKWIKKNTSLQFEILLLTSGPLRADFEQLGKTFLLSELTGGHTYPARIKRKLLKTSLDDQYKKAVDDLAKRGYDLIYGNTIVTLPWLKIFKADHRAKTLCCIHELSYVLNYFFTGEYLTENLNNVDTIIAVSKAVRENLINNYNVATEKIELQYEFIDTGSMPVIKDLKREDLGITADEFIIGMGGTPEWRKGTDLLIPLVLKLLELYPDFKFKLVWLGGGKEDGFVNQLLYDAQKCGIENKLLFIESNAAPLDFISLFDVFVLLSREDPFPLIALEAAFLKKPVIAFENSGGIPELINEGAGLLAPYLDITQLAKQVYKLRSEKDLLNKMAGTANKLIVSKYSSAIVPPNIYGLIEKLINAPYKTVSPVN